MRSATATTRTSSTTSTATDLDLTVWVPHYLPQWSSRAASAATYAVRDSCLHLTIPADQGLWCPDEHDPLRVSGVQSGVFSGPVGSTVGQQPRARGRGGPRGPGDPVGLDTDASGASRCGPAWT